MRICVCVCVYEESQKRGATAGERRREREKERAGRGDMMQSEGEKGEARFIGGARTRCKYPRGYA